MTIKNIDEEIAFPLISKVKTFITNIRLLAEKSTF